MLGLVGKGGGGEVWKAWDLVLQRYVALKFLAGDDPANVARVLNEARLQARVDHPHVCHVHEVGELEGRPFIAMQFIAGKNLRAAAAGLGLERVVAVFREVCLAVHAAHRIGLIHRDLKPTNVLVSEGEDGELTPFVTDFGLARVGSAGVARKGYAVGTPGYMAPEQARGEFALQDRRTDVFGLGAMLYELLTRRLPFPGKTSTAAIAATLTRAPADPTVLRPSLPADLTAIVLKCLEKRQEDRYQSARLLADDLQRFLDGEPVTARAADPVYRVRKFVARHRALLALGVVSLAIVLALVALQVRGSVRARQQAALARQLGQQVKELEVSMRLAAMLPLHDIGRERSLARVALRRIEQTAARAGALGRGPGHDALGRAFLALGEVRRAREELQLAWDAGYRESETALALGRALGELYQQGLAELERFERRSGQDALRGELEAKYRDPALAVLRRARGQLTGETPGFVEALLAFYERRFAEAIARLDHERSAAAWYFEALTLRGDAYLALGNERRQRGELEGAVRLFDAAETAYASACERARSDPAAHLGRCELDGLRIYLDGERGVSPEPAYRAAVAACGDALTADPGSSRAHNALANAHKRWASHLADRGEDSAAAVRLAVASAARALELDPSSAYAFLNLGVGHRMLGEQAGRAGRDAETELRVAVECFEKARALEPNLVHATNNLGLVWLARARLAAGEGRDAGPALDRAADAFREVLDRDPTFFYALNNLGDVELERARTAANADNARAHLAAAQASFRSSLAMNPRGCEALRGVTEVGAAAAALPPRGGPGADRLIAEARSALVELAGCHPAPELLTRLGRTLDAAEGAVQSTVRQEDSE
jgi:eukaryotic-like serine/threonine-protein kinase